MATVVTACDDTDNVRVTISNERGPVGPAGGGGGGAAIWGGITGTLSDQTDLQAALDLKAPLASPAFTGTVTADHIHGNLAGSVYLHVRAGEALSKGDPVYVSGSHGTGASMVPIVSRADASDIAKMPAIAIMDAAVANNGSGHAVISGTIADLDTEDYAINATLYVDEGGGMTATKPANAQPVARVERSNANNGGIVVKVNGLYSDVSIASSQVTDATAQSTPNTIAKRDTRGSAAFGIGETYNTDYEVYIGGDYPISGLENGNLWSIDQTAITADRSYALPDASGTILLDTSPQTIPIITESTASRTLSASDLGAKIRVTTAGGCAITIPANLGVAGAAIIVRRATGAGAISLTLGGGVTVNNSGVASIAAGQEFALVAVGSNEWDFVVGGNAGRTLITDTVTGTASDQSLRADVTWNTTGAPTALQVNATETGSGSGAGALLGNWSLNGNSVFSILKDGVGIGDVRRIRFNSSLGAAAEQFGVWWFNNQVAFNVSAFLGANSGAIQLGNAASIGWSSATQPSAANADLRLFRDGADILAQRRDANAQAFRLYNRFVSATEFERLNFRWVDEAGVRVAKIGTEKGTTGTNTARPLQIETDGVSRAQFAANENSLEMLGASSSIILRSPNNTRYRVTVTDAGALVTTAI